MKKLHLPAIAILLIFHTSVFAKQVDPGTARQAARNFYFERLAVNMNQPVAFQDLRLSSEFTIRENGEPIYYIFNFTDYGYIIIAADDACYPVLGYSYNAPLSPDMIPEVMQRWLDNYKHEILSVRSRELVADDVAEYEWQRLSSPLPVPVDGLQATSDVAPLITSLWNQDFPFNAMCPEDPASSGSYQGRVPVGCVATSMSQIMQYWRYPETGNSSHCIYPVQSAYGQQCANFGSTTYDWNGMPDQTSLESDALAVVSYHCGVAVDMQYDPNGSGSNLQKSAYALKTYFKYASTTYYQNRSSNYNTWVDLLKTNVENGRPVQYAGDDNYAGHAFVLDGYQQAGSDYMFHFNWGWGGSANGYFYINNLNPNGNNFNYHQGAVLNIEPDPNQYPSQYYCNGTTNITTLFGSLEDGSGPIADYPPNSNCSWLIAPDDSIKNITFKFTRFSTASDHFVKIYDGADASAPLLGSYSGNLTTMPSVTSTGPKMFITFSSTGTGTGQGWHANYSTTSYAFCTANTNITYPAGDITDGSNRFEYRNLTNCKWKITPPGVTKVVITAKSFNTEQDKDKLLIYDLGTGSLLATWTGNYSTLPPPVTSATGGVMLMWGTNGSVRGEGWEISFSPMVGSSDAPAFRELSVWPNPASTSLNVGFHTPGMQNLTISVLSPDGIVLITGKSSEVSGDYMKTLDISGLSKGIYLVSLSSDQGRSVRKIVVQ